jgi:hypothetical protein
MKKITFVILLFALISTGCGEKYSYEQIESKAIVMGCEKGTYHPNEYYESIAYMYLAQGDYSTWCLYMSLAETNGTYDYKILINFKGNNHIVIREEQYEAGQEITVTIVNTYNADSQLVKTEVK